MPGELKDRGLPENGESISSNQTEVNGNLCPKKVVLSVNEQIPNGICNGHAAKSTEIKVPIKDTEKDNKDKGKF